MPIPCPHFKITIVKRSQGQSAVAGAAYQSSERLFSEYDQRTKFYNKKKELVHAEIMLPSHAPPRFADRATLWNAVEAVENQWNSQLARRIVLAFPVEVPKEQYLSMIKEFCQEQFVSKGMIADFAIHDKGDGNPHAHILLTIRAMDEHGRWLPKARKVYDLDENGERIQLPSGNWKCHKENTVDWNDQKYAEVWRHGWETITNRYLEAAGRPERVDLRSFERQGIQQIPTVHLGPAAHQMEKRGVETFLGNLNRDIRAANSLMQSIRSAIRGLQRWIADLNEKKQLLLDALEKAKEPTLSDLLVDYFNLRNEQRSDWSGKAKLKCAVRDFEEVKRAVDYLKAHSLNTVAVDLEKFLRAQGETLVPSGKEYRWKAHDSLTVCGNKWFRHSQSKGGFPVDFVMEFYGKSFPEAVQMLTGEPGEAQPEAGPAPSPAFRLPLRNVTNANILNYLTQERKLSPSLVNFFIAAGDIYEDAAHHNVVFVGRDADGHPRYASSRGINEKFRQDAAGAEKAFGFAHRGTDKQLLVFEAPIDLLSFIELFPKNWQQHNYLSLGGVSGKALQQFLSERPDVERVFLCLDADKAGEDACKRLAALLPDTVSVTRIQPCMKDWNDVLVHRAEISNRNYFKSIVLKEPSKPETVKIIRMSDVELTPVEWLWKPYLPFGKLSVLQGNPGEGKTYFAMHLAAACTNGKLLPNMERMEPFNVIYQTAEDGLGDTVKPRLIEAGADLDRVLVIDDSDVQLTLSDERIEKAIVENNARLVIIDPIQAYLGSDVDMNRANEVRPIFMRLGQVAQRTGCAILLIGHLNKAAGMQSLQRGLGSIDIAAAVRSVMFIGKLKHDPTMRILTHEKSSLAPPGVSLAFSLGDEGGFRWVGEYDITADEMLSGIEPQRETKTQQAKDLICALLAGGKQVFSEDIDKAALERGIPGRTVRDAKRELGDALKSKIVEGRKKVFWME